MAEFHDSYWNNATMSNYDAETNQRRVSRRSANTIAIDLGFDGADDPDFLVLMEDSGYSPDY